MVFVAQNRLLLWGVGASSWLARVPLPRVVRLGMVEDSLTATRPLAMMPVGFVRNLEAAKMFLVVVVATGFLCYMNQVKGQELQLVVMTLKLTVFYAKCRCVQRCLCTFYSAQALLQSTRIVEAFALVIGFHYLKSGIEIHVLADRSKNRDLTEMEVASLLDYEALVKRTGWRHSILQRGCEYFAPPRFH